ncbi:hypothetical protein PCANC_16558 [Puccinia coronata f. sp. avenae]|uniref:Uncharacterized protein n=1 Tax=Puccinia coronata f. sp. avenae TaxID=200324 RepID=A0A2N5SH29_9BASI|nr:hypothetical protein PCANC_16558 [Puccinia coronata f. sp. avenae]
MAEVSESGGASSDHIPASLSHDEYSSGVPSRMLWMKRRDQIASPDNNNSLELQGSPQPNLSDQNMSSKTDNQSDSTFVSDQSAEAQIRGLRRIADVFHRVRLARDNPEVLEADPTLKSALLKEKEVADNSLENIRAWLINSFDQKDLNPARFNLARGLKNGMKREESALWENIWSEEVEDYRFKKRTQGFFGYFYSLWKFFFAQKTWEKQQLRQSLRKILRQLPDRLLFDEERVVLQLEKVQKAGFEITWQEQRLAQKISEMSQDLTDGIKDYVPLDINEGSLLDTMSFRTVSE